MICIDFMAFFLRSINLTVKYNLYHSTIKNCNLIFLNKYNIILPTVEGQRCYSNYRENMFHIKCSYENDEKKSQFQKKSNKNIDTKNTD